MCESEQASPRQDLRSNAIEICVHDQMAHRPVWKVRVAGGYSHHDDNARQRRPCASQHRRSSSSTASHTDVLKVNEHPVLWLTCGFT